MRPRATRQTDWAQLGIGACVLVLSPLALGAALYSMLEPADRDVMRSGGTDAVLPDNAQPAPQTGLPVTAAGGPVEGARQFPGLSASAEGRAPVEVVTRSISVPAAPMPAVAANPPAYAATEGAATQSPPVSAAAPKRSIRRNAQRQAQQQPQQQDVIKTWLQQIGLLPPYH
jgi:hypothetical protein